MNSVLAASRRAVSKATLFRRGGAIAFLAAITSFGIADLLQTNLGDVGLYLFVPVVAALLGLIVVASMRLRLVGFLPADAEHLIPLSLRRWARFWLVMRLGLLGGMLLLLVGIAGNAVVGGPVKSSVEALVYVVWLRLFLDMAFGVVFNMGIISQRRSAA